MIGKFVLTVKRQLSYFERQIDIWSPERPGYSPTKLAKYGSLAEEFRELLEFLQDLRRSGYDQGEDISAPTVLPFPQPPGPAVERAAQSAHSATSVATAAAPRTTIPKEPKAKADSDLSDLPPELLKELSGAIKGETDPLIEIIEDRGGTATLDEILIDLFRKYKEIGKRPIVSNKLYRLSRRGLCWPVPGKKGVYTTIEPIDGGSDTSANDDGSNVSDTGTSNPSSHKPKSSASPTSTASSKTRRDLFASTAIPSSRVPH